MNEYIGPPISTNQKKILPGTALQSNFFQENMSYDTWNDELTAFAFHVRTIYGRRDVLFYQCMWNHNLDTYSDTLFCTLLVNQVLGVVTKINDEL